MGEQVLIARPERRCTDWSDDEAYGERLLEVLSVHVDGGRYPSGTVTVYDGKRGQKIYSRREDQPKPAPSTSSPRHHQNEILLTGPFRAIVANGCIGFVLNLHDGSQDQKKANQSQILVDLYDPTTKYDELISTKLDTGYGPAEVRYAVLSNAIECDVEVKLVLGDDSAPAYAHGTITACSELLKQDIVLFDGEIMDATSPELILPLARSVLAAPLKWSLKIEVVLRGSSGEELARDHVMFYPVLDDEHVSHAVANSGIFEVKMTWSDDQDY
ncbi:hypothetical protein CFC21_085817 [Triticum aestivum]|uniref:DUF6598 domain-containing protein n=2 Tax=Triticum aestivum TaxID=4565 RepID=A0A3B6PG22_WHEAT|nr:60 kDa jasmonate-induced protein-like [Triticum aestivum]KAF7081912.1 hypothetical protein CFC21_085817 [Triticum aestivum]